MAVTNLILNIMSQNANLVPSLSIWPVPLVPTDSQSIPAYVRAANYYRGGAGRSGFRLGSLEDNHSLGKSKLDEICPPLFFFPHSQHLEKVQPHNSNWEGKC